MDVRTAVLSAEEAAGDEPWLYPQDCWFCEGSATLALHHSSASYVAVCRRHRAAGLSLVEDEWASPLVRVYLVPLRVGPSLLAGRDEPRRPRMSDL